MTFQKLLASGTLCLDCRHNTDVILDSDFLGKFQMSNCGYLEVGSCIVSLMEKVEAVLLEVHSDSELGW